MGYSRVGLIEPVMRLLWKIRPKTILDVGSGTGIYGALTRVFLGASHYKELADGKVTGKQLKIDGVEPWDFTPLEFDRSYDMVHRQSTMDFVKLHEPTEPYHLVLAIHVLDHLSREDGEKFLTWCERYAENVIVADSLQDFGEPSPVPNSPFEEHRSHWTPEEFKTRAGARLYGEKDFSWLVWYQTAHAKDRSRPGWKDIWDQVGGRWEWL